MSEHSTAQLSHHLNVEQESQSDPDEHCPDSPTLGSLAHPCTDECLSNPFATISSYSNPFSVDATHDDSPTQDSNFFSSWHLNSDSYSDSDSETVSCFLTDLFDNRSSQQLDDFSDSSSYINPFYAGGFQAHDGSSGLGFVGVVPSQRDSSVDGLRVTGLDSTSDSDSGVAGEVDREVEFSDWVNENDGDRDSWFSDSGMGLCWDNLVLEYQRTMLDNPESEGLEEREDISVVIDEDEDLSAASGFSNGDDETGEEAWRYLEWQILLAINNLGRDTNLEGDAADSAFDVQDAYVPVVDYDTIFGHLMEDELAFKVNPPASKKCVEHLPSVELTLEDLQKNISTCAICKDDILVEEKLTRLPCLHYYHGECIFPWLSIRNTCPVCRFELPTDDPDYERRKLSRSILNLSGFTGQFNSNQFE